LVYSEHVPLHGFGSITLQSGVRYSRLDSLTLSEECSRCIWLSDRGFSQKRMICSTMFAILKQA
jgi:hypothetical protein